MRLSSSVKLISTFGVLLVVVASLTIFGATRGISHASQSSTRTGVTSANTTLSCGAWTVVPNPAGPHSYLDGVAPVSANDAWAVGYVATTTIPTLQTLTEHWDGTGWSIIPSPNPGSESNVLRAVSAISTSDIWAVGYLSSISGTSQTLIEHWNGSNWSVVPSPNGGGVDNDLFGVASISTKDVWVVGSSYGSGAPGQILTEHWNGTQWSIVSNPVVGGGLSAVAAISANNVWAIGGYSKGILTEHWNGTSWSVVPSLSRKYMPRLSGVAQVPNTGQVWAVGAQNKINIKTLTQQWNGTAWSIISSPNVGTQRSLLNGVVAISSGDVWAVGTYNYTPVQTLIEHWDGKKWVIPSAPSVTGVLQAVGQVPGTGQLWAVGDYTIGNGSQGLIEFYC